MTNDMAGQAEAELQLVPASGRAHLWLAILVLGMPAVIAVVVLTATGTTPQDLLDRFLDSPLVPLLVGVFVVLLWFALDRLMRRHHLRLDAQGLEVTTSLYRQKLTLDQLQLGDARVIDLGERTDLAPLLKFNGLFLPGFRSGWFLTRRFKKQFAAMAGGKRVLWLPTTKGHPLLLQPRNPQALLDRLRTLSTSRQAESRHPQE